MINYKHKDVLKEGVEFLVDAIVTSSDPPPSEEALKSMIKEMLNIEDVAHRFSSAMSSIRDHLQRRCSPIEVQDVRREWVSCKERLNGWLLSKNSQQLEPLTPLQEILGISFETYNLFYDVGRELYLEEKYEKAADLFFFLAFLNHSFYNVWLMLGLAEKGSGHFKSALRAFAMATIMDEKVSEPLLYSAECCFQMGDINEAKLYLEEAKMKGDKR